MLLLTISSKILSSSGKVIQENSERRCNSLVSNFLKFLSAGFASGQIFSYVDVSGVTRSGTFGQWWFKLDGNNNSSIRIGSGTNPVTMDDYKLQSEITTGISWGAPNIVYYSVGDSTAALRIIRSFTDTTGSSRNVNEVALYTIDSNYYMVMIERTLYSAVIPAFGTLTLTYSIYSIL